MTNFATPEERLLHAIFGDDKFPSDGHRCHAAGCITPVPPRMFMCRPHWLSLPRIHRDAIWATYVPGQEDRKDPSPEYLEAARAAIDWLRETERG